MKKSGKNINSLATMPVSLTLPIELYNDTINAIRTGKLKGFRSIQDYINTLIREDIYND